MAAGRLPEPGTSYGPCMGACSHRDCAETRTMAGTSCRICRDPIGYGSPFYHEGDQKARPFVLSHASCLEDEIELEQRVS